jgi:putative aldouronate transport system permease protein
MKKKSSDVISFNIIAYTVTTLFALFAVVPFLILLVNSFQNERMIDLYGYSLWPRQFSLEAYTTVFSDPIKIVHAYGVTIFVTVVGTVSSLFFSTMAAYVLFRKEVRYKFQLSFFVYFTSLFNGGLVAWYLTLSATYHLHDTIWVLILSPLFNAFYVIMLRNFLKGSIPDAIIESAKIDGAGDFRIFIQMVLPLAKASMASIGLFIALFYWNDWFTPMIFLFNEKLFPMQYVLYRILSSQQASAEILDKIPGAKLPTQSLKLAFTVIATGPIVALYPFVQKYFVKGITIGSVKG